jgi:hypothetical protein
LLRRTASDPGTHRRPIYVENFDKIKANIAKVNVIQGARLAGDPESATMAVQEDALATFVMTKGYQPHQSSKRRKHVVNPHDMTGLDAVKSATARPESKPAKDLRKQHGVVEDSRAVKVGAGFPTVGNMNERDIVEDLIEQDDSGPNPDTGKMSSTQPSTSVTTPLAAPRSLDVGAQKENNLVPAPSVNNLDTTNKESTLATVRILYHRLICISIERRKFQWKSNINP